MENFRRKPKKQILLNNAYESWTQAVKNARDIKDGLVSLQYRKAFVSNLHNAVELFFKQIMLDQNDYRVVSVKSNKLNCKGEPMKLLYESDDLNNYFDSLSPDERKIFFSIEFNEIIDIHRQLLSSFFTGTDSFKIPLDKLKNLRNNETHFFIDSFDFLSEEDFIVLHNFMCDFNTVLTTFNLFPFWGRPSAEYKKLFFNDCKIKEKSFSYNKAIIDSKTIKKIKEIIDGQCIGFTTSAFDIVNLFEKEFWENGITFNEAYNYVQTLIERGFITFDDYIDEIENEYGQVETVSNGYLINVSPKI